jgi:Flp pilus assembly protein TadD
MNAVHKVSLSREEIGLLVEAGIIYRESRNFQAARDVFSGLRALYPRNDVPETLLGTVAFHEGEFETAEQHYRRALELNPQSAYAWSHLGEVALFRGDSSSARAHMRKALEIDPRGDFGNMARRLLQLADVTQEKGKAA